MNYQEFLQSKLKKALPNGFEVDASELNPMLFDFQKIGVLHALSHGRFALFEDCGLGKTFQFLEWARIIADKTNAPVLILSPLAVVEQTIDEGEKFNIPIERLNPAANVFGPHLYITNYDQLKNVDCSPFSGVVLDESSILKGRDGKLSRRIIESFARTPYRLACTATPSPNDHMELGQHSEFLGYMGYLEILAMYFVHDGGETSKWRLRKHAKDAFWKYVSSWSMSLDTPHRIGCHIEGYELPHIEYVEHFVKVPNTPGLLFPDAAVSASNLHADLRVTMDERIEKVAALVNGNDDQWIVWCLGNKEAEAVSRAIPGSVNVQGSDSAETKAEMLGGFAKNKFRVLVTKAEIAAFGMNYQNCHNMVFCSYDFKFEKFYQAVRRCYRFGQKHAVRVHLMVPESQLNVKQSIETKQQKHFEMIAEMSKYSAEFDYSTAVSKFTIEETEIKEADYWLMCGDAVQEIKKVDDHEADIVVFSPPFAELYVYSDSPNDMGNSSDYEQFAAHFQFLIPELHRTLKPGRICAVHCMDLPIQKGKEGYIGLRDFSGMLIDWFTAQGFIYHAKTTIWKNPVTEMQRTKALGLLHKTIKKDSAMSRVGIPDYVLFFRAPGENQVPITHQDTDPASPDYLPVDLWQKYASPVWMDVDYSRTLNYRSARDTNDEKHICPLQLDTIERILHLYSNEGETVLSPFGGIGSEGYTALKMNRKSISIELKPSYFAINVNNHRAAIAERATVTMF